ncbi:MAG: hypothetical protein LBT29_08375 [Flavobacteriaceae bacterium]|jgi:hypothetical protein|nr:hypothetical protein [Flavobacteriaceae bacterium]
MKKYIVTITAAIVVTGYAQVGIQTFAPQQTLHIDAGGNNNNVSPTTDIQKADDVVVSNKAFVGVGEPNPDQKLVINGKMRINDGTQGSGKLLVSDEKGKASWQGNISTKGKYGHWSLKGTDLYRTTAGNDTISLHGTSTLPADMPNSIGLQTVANGVLVPKGKYFISLNGDISTKREYCYLYIDVDGKETGHVAYAEWLSGATFYIEISNPKGAVITLRWLNRLTAVYYDDVTNTSVSWGYAMDFHQMGNLLF